MFVVTLFFALSFLSFRAVFPDKYSEFVERQAERFGLERAEVYAVIMAESRFDKNAVSRVGACGLMQLMPATAEFCARMTGMKDPDLFDPETNITLGCYYLSYLKESFDGENVYAAYNAGEGTVRLWLEKGSGIAFPETAEYVKRVTDYKKIYTLLYFFAIRATSASSSSATQGGDRTLTCEPKESSFFMSKSSL